MNGVLSDVEIEALVVAGRLKIHPFDVSMLRPSSYALRLSSLLLVFDGSSDVIDVSDPALPSRFIQKDLPDENVLISPGEFCLASSVEEIALPPDHAALLSVGSRVARLGLAANNGSVLVHANYGAERPSSITFELTNLTTRPIVLKAGMPFCHLMLLRHDVAATRHVMTPGLGGPGPKPARFE